MAEDFKIDMRILYGSIEIEPHPTRCFTSRRVDKDAAGKVTYVGEWNHIVCCGVYECDDCGRVLAQRPKWWEFWK